MNDQEAFAVAIEEARLSYKEGGVPIGAALVSRDGKLLGSCWELLAARRSNPALKEVISRDLNRGHNMRVQKGSPIHHGETSALENSGRLPASAYKGATMFTTLSPCDMCTGACILYGISRVVIGENETFLGGESYLRHRGIEVVNMKSKECKDLMDLFIEENPEIWNEDIGEEERVHSKESK